MCNAFLLDPLPLPPLLIFLIIFSLAEGCRTRCTPTTLPNLLKVQSESRQRIPYVHSTAVVTRGKTAHLSSNNHLFLIISRFCYLVYIYFGFPGRFTGLVLPNSKQAFTNGNPNRRGRRNQQQPPPRSVSGPPPQIAKPFNSRDPHMSKMIPKPCIPKAGKACGLICNPSGGNFSSLLPPFFFPFPPIMCMAFYIGLIRGPLEGLPQVRGTKWYY